MSDAIHDVEYPYCDIVHLTTCHRRDSQREAEERKKQAISERTRLLSSRQVESGEVRDSSRLSDSARSDISVQQQLAQGGLRRERRSSLRRSSKYTASDLLCKLIYPGHVIKQFFKLAFSGYKKFTYKSFCQQLSTS